MRKLLKLISPYSLTETLCWPYYKQFPSYKNKTGILFSKLPWQQSFVNKKSPTKKILFFGDLLPVENEKPVYCTEKIRAIFKNTDLIIGNLEGPITERNICSGRRSFFTRDKRFSKQNIENLLENFSIDPKKLIFSLANNHLEDYLELGIINTIQYLDELKIKHVGVFFNNTSNSFYQLGPLGIFIFAWTQWENKELKNINRKPNLFSNFESIEHEYSKGKQKIDLKISIPHWGYEFKHFPSDEEMFYLNQLVEKKYKLIVGHHSHVIGPFYKLNNSFCLFSLGNLIGIHDSWPTKLGNLLEVEVVESGEYKGEILQIQYHPIYFFEKGSDKTVVHVEELETPLKIQCLNRLKLLFP